MNFIEARNTIREKMMKGDAQKIAKMAGKSTVILYNALNKNSIEQMTTSEKQMWQTTLLYFEKKSAANAELEERTIALSKQLGI